MLFRSKQHGVRRFVLASGLMVGAARGMNVLQRTGVAIFRAMNRALYRDKVLAENEVRGSAGEWVIVRPPVFGEVAARGTYRIGVDLDVKLRKMSNADVAAALLSALTDDKHLRQAVEISY